MRLVFAIPSTLLTVLLITPGCTTTPKPAGKPYESCLCGPTIDTAGQPYCAIWGDTKNPSQPTKVWQSDQRANCEAADCSQLFSKFCQKIQMVTLPRPTLPPPGQACYCDAILIENDRGQVQLNCAAWSDDSKNLIEYYSLEDCSPQRCGEAPFVRAPRICGHNFKAFYPPMVNHR